MISWMAGARRAKRGLVSALLAALCVFGSVPARPRLVHLPHDLKSQRMRESTSCRALDAGAPLKAAVSALDGNFGLLAGYSRGALTRLGILGVL